MSKKSFDRRNFLKTSVLGTAGAVTGGKLMASENFTNPSNQFVDEGIIKREIGNTGIKVPIVSMGVMNSDNPNLVRACLDKGMTFLDTAHVYQNGNNEKMLGEVLNDYSRDDFYIASKVPPQDSKEEFLNKLDTSLERLKLDYVDILYLHAISSREDTLNPTMVDALKTAKRQGKIKHAGVSTHKNEPEVIQAAIDSDVYEVVLTAINFKQDHKDKILEKINKAGEAGVGIVAMKTMAGGNLDKKTKKSVNYQAALKWALKNENVNTSIPGMINFDQLETNAPVMKTVNLTPEEENFIESASLEQGMYCNGCEECVKSCSKNPPIPEMMRAYMYAYGYKEMKMAKDVLVENGVQESPCVDCNICTARCVKGFNVNQKLNDISRIAKIHDDFLV